MSTMSKLKGREVLERFDVGETAFGTRSPRGLSRQHHKLRFPATPSELHSDARVTE